MIIPVNKHMIIEPLTIQEEQEPQEVNSFFQIPEELVKKEKYGVYRVIQLSQNSSFDLSPMNDFIVLVENTMVEEIDFCGDKIYIVPEIYIKAYRKSEVK